MPSYSSPNQDRDEARRKLVEAAERTRSLRQPMDWRPYSPFLQDPLLDCIGLGTWETFLMHESYTMLKQVGLRLGRSTLQTIFENGVMDVANAYKPVGREQNTTKGMLMLVKHAVILGDAARCVSMDLPGSRYAGRYETAADLIIKWCRKGLTVTEMMQGMSLDVTYSDTFPYTHLQAWERVHLAMRNLPGVSVSRPGRLSLTRLVFEWLNASRGYGREHELELMNQIDVYAHVEERFGKSEAQIADLYEVKDQYHRKRILESKLGTTVDEPEIIQLAPTLSIMGGALPRTHMLGSMDREVIHQQVRMEQSFHIELAEEPFRHGDEIEWRG